MDIDTLTIGDKVRTIYGDQEWIVFQIAAVTDSVAIKQMNRTGKQILRTTWVQIDELAEVVPHG